VRWFAKAWASVLKDARIDASYRVSFVLEAFDGLLMLVAYGFLAGLFGGRALDGYAPLGFLLVGVAANSALPATHALNAMRDVLLGGAGLVAVMPELLTLAAFGAVGIPLGLGALLFAIRYARQEGTVGHV